MREDEGFFNHDPEGGWCSVCTGTGCSEGGVAVNAGGPRCAACGGTGLAQRTFTQED